LQILQVVETAVERARAGKGPTLIEVRTVHGGVHELRDGSLPFPFETPSRLDGSENSEESASLSAHPTAGASVHDPVVNLETFLVEHGLLQPVEQGLILDGIERFIKEGLQLAAEGPFPDKGALSEGVYAARSVAEEQSTSDGVGA
jgi:pyruvate dehydrogenase E1 component alpha subunit